MPHVFGGAGRWPYLVYLIPVLTRMLLSASLINWVSGMFLLALKIFALLLTIATDARIIIPYRNGATDKAVSDLHIARGTRFIPAWRS